MLVENHYSEQESTDCRVVRAVASALILPERVSMLSLKVRMRLRKREIKV